MEISQKAISTFFDCSGRELALLNKHGFASGGYTAPNPPNGAALTYYLPAEKNFTPELPRKSRRLSGTITDGAARPFAPCTGLRAFGVNRVAWNLHYDGPRKLDFLPPREGYEERRILF